MTAFKRRLDILECIPSYPRKITSTDILNKLVQLNYQGLSIRKVQRDLEHIEEMNMYGLEADKRSKPYGWSINLNWRKLNISVMDENTALAFSTLKHVASNIIPESTMDDLTDYFDKAETILDENSSTGITHWKNSVGAINSPSPITLPMADDAALAMIKKALFNKKQFSADIKRYLVVNQSPVWKKYTKINPLGLIQRDQVLTLFCSFGRNHQKIYKIPVNFIRDVTIEDEHIVENKKFNIEYAKQSYFKSNSTSEEITLTLNIKKDSYFMIGNGRFSEDQVVAKTDNPEYAYLRATVADTPKLRAFLRGMGLNVEVLGPPKLREYFKQLSVALNEQYKSD